MIRSELLFSDATYVSRYNYVWKGVLGRNKHALTCICVVSPHAVSYAGPEWAEALAGLFTTRTYVM